MKVTPLFNAVATIQPNGSEDAILATGHFFLVEDEAGLWVACSPVGMWYDGWSVPIGFRNLVSKRSNHGQPGGVFHDSGYHGVAVVWRVEFTVYSFSLRRQFTEMPKSWWDHGFLACNETTGVPRWRRWTAYQAVHLGGGSAWKSSHQEHAMFYAGTQVSICQQWGLPMPSSQEELTQDARLALVAHGDRRFSLDNEARIDDLVR